MQRIYLKDKSYQVETLPSEPALLVELIDLCHNDAATFEMFTAAIGKDISLTAKLLQVADSPAYRQWNETTDIRRILIVLGLWNVKQLVITNAIQHFFASFGRKFDNNLQFLWFRSLVCASLAKKLADYIGYANPEEAYLTGLLHQVGQLLFLLNHKKDYPPILRGYYQAENFQQLEKEKFGVDHCELGAALIESWKMDSFIADAVLFQHAPVEELQCAPLLLKILAVAGPLSSQNYETAEPASLERAGQLFNMTEASILDCLSQALEQSKQMVEVLGYDADFYVAHNYNKVLWNDRQQESEAGLAERIKNIALTRGGITAESGGIEPLAGEIRIAFSALFGISSLLFFQADPEKEQLVPVNDLKLKQLNEIRLQIENRNSLLARSFNERRRHHFRSGSGSVTDRQILKLLKTESAYILPIHSGGVTTGVIVAGVPAEKLSFAEEKLPFIELLTKEIARVHKSLHDNLNRERSISLTEFGKITHEVSNPLTIIKNYLYILGKKIEQNHPAQEELGFINDEIERVGNILLRAKDPDSSIPQAGKPLNINALLTNLDGVLQNSLYKTSGTASCLSLDPGIPQLQASEDKLKQILINLLKNAVEAMGTNGRIDISTRDHYFQNGREYVEISLKDNGPGIPAEILSSLFKPVASTKQGHSGLGLSIVKNLVDELAGSIACYSSPEFGTEFKILVPRETKTATDGLRP